MPGPVKPVKSERGDWDTDAVTVAARATVRAGKIDLIIVLYSVRCDLKS